ncbi:MAG: Swt1 family HEPN domain-containing protein, partial [Limisphaerales bacterium]
MKAKGEHFVRAFGMSGFQITSELQNLEKKFNLEFGHTKGQGKQAEADLYPQFEKEVRIEAAEMASHFEAFYCLEKSIRKMITETMAEALGSTWWDSGKLPQAVGQEVQARIKKEIDSGFSRRSLDKLDYTTFGELTDIIISNWDLFGSIFSSRRAVERVLSNLNTLRNPIAHCSRLSDDEVLRLQLTV